MARIPRTEASIPIRLANQPTMPTDLLTGPGRALQGLGKAIGGLQGAFEASSEPSDTDKFNAQLQLVKFQNDMELDQQQRQETFSGKPDGFTQSSLDRFGEREAELRRSIPDNPKLQQQAALHLERMRGGYHRNAYGFEQKQRQGQMISDIGATATGEIARTQPGNVDELDVRLQGVEKMIDAAPGLSEPQRQQLRATANQAALTRILETVPDEDKADLADTLIKRWTDRLSAPPGQQPGPSGAVTPMLLDDQRSKLDGVKSDVVSKFAELQGALGRTFNVNSGYRDPEHNARVGGAKNSQHTHRNAIDIDVRDMSPEQRINVIEKASALGFKGIGVYDNAIHIDMGRTRAWGPSYGRDTVPKWAEGAIKAHESGAFASASGSSNGGSGPSFSSSVNSAIDKAAKEHGIDPSLMRAFAKIESGGDPDNRTGSYKGLFQLSNSEFEKHGGSGDIYDAEANANAAARKFKAESVAFKEKFGRDPTATDLYMVHQQGEAGYAAHMQNPDAPAWENMASTAEGRSKGDGWSKKAIWGNVPTDVREKFGSVENITSRDFVALLGSKVQRFGGGADTGVGSVAPEDAPAPGRPGDKPTDGAPPVAERGLTRYAGLGKTTDANPGAEPPMNGAAGSDRPTNTIPGAAVETKTAELKPTWLKPSIRTNLVEDLIKMRPALRAKQDEAIKRLEGAITVGKFISGERPFNPYSDGERKLVDETFKLGDLDKRMFAGDPAAIARGVEVAQRLNYAPQPVQEALTGLVRDTDPKNASKRSMGYEAASSILDRNPHAFIGSGGKDLGDEARAYTALVRGGKTSQLALARIDEMKTPEWQTKAEVRKKAAFDMEKTITASDVAKEFADPKWYNPWNSGTPDVPDLFLNHYSERFREHYTRLGDEASARALAGQDMKKTYGVSEITGTIMQYPPDAHYPAIGPKGREYLKKDLEATVRSYLDDVARGPLPPTAETDAKAPKSEIDMSSIRLRSDGKTAADIAAGRPPRYEVAYVDERGMTQFVPGMRWGLNAEHIEAERKKFEGAVLKKRSDNAAQLKEMVIEPQNERRSAVARKGAQGLIEYFEGKRPALSAPPAANTIPEMEFDP